MNRALTTLLLCSVSHVALAQSVQQSGNVTPGHPAYWVTNGVVADGGPPTQGNLTGVGVTFSGPAICQASAFAPSAYNLMCFNVTGTGATLSLQNIGGATGGLAFLNGTANFALPTNNGTSGYVLQTDGAGNTSWTPQTGGGGGAVSSVFGRTGVVAAMTGDYTITQITNAVTTVFGRNGAVVATTGDYTIAQVTNGLSNALAQYNFFIGNGSGVATATPMGGDATYGAGGLIVTKSNGTPFAASAFTDTTVAANITSGILSTARLSGNYSGISGSLPSVTGVGTLTAGQTAAGFTVDLTASTVAGTLTVPNGGTGTTTFTANLPLIGNVAGAIAQGTRSGSTTKYVTTTGTLTNGDCVSIDSGGNFVDAGGACTTGGGGGTVSSGTTSEIGYYASSGTTISGLSTGNNGVLVTNGSGVPSISTTLPSGLTIPGPAISNATVTASFTATGLVTNADLTNPAVTVFTTGCTLGATCTPTVTGTNLAVNTVANSNLAQMAAGRIKCNPGASTANAADCTVAQVISVIGAQYIYSNFGGI